MVEKAKIVAVPVAKPGAAKGGAGKGGQALEIVAHFNPQTLKISYANESKGGNQSGGSAKQFVGQKTSKLSVELLFDTTVAGTDVRIWTTKVASLMEVQKKGGQGDQRTPPSARFEWGTFQFLGVIDSMQETLDYFSEQGMPLRATVSLGMTGLDVLVSGGDQKKGDTPDSARKGVPGTAPLETPRPGESLASQAGRNGNSSDWKSIASANNIDDPLRLSAGAQLNMNAGAGASISGSLGLSAGAGISAGAGFSAGLGGGIGFAASGEASVGIGGSAGAGASFGAGGGASAGASFGAGGSVGASAGFSADSGLGASASFGAGGGASVSGGFDAGAGFGAGGSLGVSGGFAAGGGVSAEAGAGFTAEADFNAV